MDELPAQARAPALIAVQPVRGAPTLLGASLRSKIARLVRDRGYRTVTTLPSIESPGQYWALARDRGLTGFVVADLTPPRRQRLSIVVLDGAQGSVLGRWSFLAPEDNPGKLLESGFWRHLGRALEKARAPDAPLIPPATEAPLDVPGDRSNDQTPFLARSGG